MLEEPLYHITMQESTTKTQYTFKSDLKAQQILEEEEITCNYSSTSSNSSSEDNGEQDELQYPTDNLGTSWGSYLQSGPPTRADTQKKVTRDHIEAVNKELAQSGIPVVRKTKPTVVLVDPSPLGRVSPQETNEHMPTLHSQVTVHVPGNKASNLQTSKKNYSIKKTSTIMTTIGEKSTPKNSVLKEMKNLIEIIHTSHKEITKNGTNTDHLRALLKVTETTYSDLQQLVGEPTSDKGVEILSSAILVDIIQYLIEVIKTLVQQSQTISQNADSLQKSGRQLSKSQDKFFKEQYEIHEAIEDARMQLIRERQLFKAEMADGKENLQRMQQTMQEQAIPSQLTTKMGTVHEVMRGRNQQVALLHTQKEQAKLEKLLVRQERDIQHIQRDLKQTKSELLSAQDHALKLEHKITTHHNQKALSKKRKEEITIQTQAITRRTTRKKYKTADSGLQGVLTTQKALDQEIARIKRQLEEQQLRERLVSKQMEENHQSLKKRAVALRKHAAEMKGKSFSAPRDGTDCDDSPRQHQKKHTYVPKPIKQKVVRAKMRKKPAFSFSKQELVTLACFSDEEAAENVMDWLEMQGTLVN